MRVKLQPKIMVKQRNLKPVKTKGKYYYNDGKLGRLLRNINRSTLEDKVLICAAVSPDKQEGLFLDIRGHEYLISAKDLNSDLEYISSKFVKKKDKKFVGVRYTSQKYNNVVKKFLERPDNKMKYKFWDKGDKKPTLSPSLLINEENNMYEVGKHYTADNGEWSFKVVDKKDDYIVIQDLSSKSKKKYKVEVADLELAKPKLNEDDEISLDVKNATEALKEKSANLYDSLGDLEETADNLKQFGRDWVNEKEPGVKDRAFLDSLIEEAKKVYNYYIITVKSKLRDIDLTELEEDYINDLVVDAKKLRNIDPNDIDLDELKVMYKEQPENPDTPDEDVEGVEEESGDEALKSYEKDLEEKYNELKKVGEDWRSARIAADKKFKKVENRIAKEKGVKATDSYNDPVKTAVRLDPEYREADDKVKDLMREHSTLTSKFKKLYKEYKNAGGKYNRDWDIASSEWDDAD